jgi:hypothetical protein
MLTSIYKNKYSSFKLENEENDDFSYEEHDDTTKLDFKFYNSYEDRLQNFIANKLKEVKEIEYIFCQREERAYLVWIVINELNPEVRRKIYKKEKDIIRLFRGEVFDFYVIARMNKPIQTIVNQTGTELIYQKQR